MASDIKEYDALPRGSVDEWSTETATIPYRRSRFALLNWTAILTTLLAVSLTANIFLIIKSAIHPELTESDCPSFYAGLKRDVPIRIVPKTEYTSENLTAALLSWGKLLGDPGVVALPSAYVKEKNLHQALPFPWDEDKSVYFLQAYHNLHCLRTLFRYINYTETGEPTRIAASHAIHCLDQLRQDVVCNADDTPRYSWPNQDGTGFNQVKMCRSWEKLEQWALERTACFKKADGVAGPMRDRFKSCPDGRVLWPTE
ncbi:hypothetical protein F5B21DRAFT_109458 [Xylaria acuta]|nr:hypothetical protein F5B21DRAFT_109458 [Xylaria acuta]